MNEAGKICAYTDKYGKSCYVKRGDRLYDVDKSWLSGKIEPDGDVKWAHGFISRPDRSPCASSYGCKVNFDDWVGQTAESYFTLEPDKIVETFNVTKDGENKYCTHGTHSKDNCFFRDGDVWTHTGGKVWGYQEPNGEIEWSHGYRSRLVNDPCVMKSKGEIEREVDEEELPPWDLMLEDGETDSSDPDVEESYYDGTNDVNEWENEEDDYYDNYEDYMN